MSDGVLLVHHIARLRSSCPAFYLNTAALVRQGCKDAQRRWNPDQVRWSRSTTHERLITWLILFTLESCWPKSSSFWDNGVFSVSASEMCFWILPKIQTQVNEARQDSLPFQFVSPMFPFMFYLHLTVDEWAPPASVSWRDKDRVEETPLFSAGRW